MSATTVLTVREWRRLRSAFRAVLGLACLYSQLYPPGREMLPVTLAAGVFAAYSLAALLIPKLDPLQTSLASLFLETIFFVAFSCYGADRWGWLGSVFYLYLMLAAVVHHDWGDVFIIVGACLGFFAFVHAPEAEVLRRIVLISGLLACGVAYQKRRLQELLADSLRREQALRIQADKVRDLERQRIAGDFHDGPLQTFIGLQVRLDILNTLMKRDRNAAAEDLKELQQIARQQVSEIRSFLRSMRPSEVDANDLGASARRIVEYFQKDTGIAARFVSSGTETNLSAETSHEALQILREALHNVQKHSKASRVVVSMEQSGKSVEFTVDDDGAGFAFSGTFNLDELDLLRIGPNSIKRRVRSLGGELQIESRPGHGVNLKIRIPG